MTASLIVAGFETYDNSVDRPMQLSGLGWIPGDPLPDQATVEQTYLDGEAVTGDRTRNRSVRIPVWVRGFSALDLAANINALYQAVTADTFAVQWTPNGGLPVIYDCYRATVTKPNNTYLADQFTAAVMIECQAKPFGRSPVAQTVTASGTTQIDSFDTAPTGATLDSGTKIEGTGAATYTGASATISRSFAAKNLSAASKVTFYYLNQAPGAPNILTITLTLTSASGSTRYTGASNITMPFGWHLQNLNLTGGTVVSGTGVTLSSVTSYTLELSNSAGSSTYNVDDLRAVGTASTQVSTTKALQQLLTGVAGAARTPVNLALTGAGNITTFLVHAPPSDQDVNATILASLSTASTNQTITVAAANANYSGTYSVVLGVGTSGGGSVTVTVTIRQMENGTGVGVTTVLTKTYTSGALLQPVGEVTLPLYDVPSDNTQTSYLIQVQITGADRYSEVMLLDTRGQTVFTDTAIGGYGIVYIDEPGVLQSGPRVYTSIAASRAAAFSIAGNCWITGGPVVLDPGTNKILAWVDSGTPVLTATYYPRWPFERSA